MQSLVSNWQTNNGEENQARSGRFFWTFAISQFNEPAKSFAYLQLVS
jgi:hypothetical protein